MAYDKPLKIQWTEINGRTVPLVLPQYWSDEQNDWVVSSEQNRLPVDAQLTGSNVEYQLLDQVEVFPGSTVFSQNLTHSTDKYYVYIQSEPRTDFWISIRHRRLDGVEAGEGVDRFEENYTNKNRIVTDEFPARSPVLNIGIRNESSEVAVYSAWLYAKGVSK